MYEIKANSDTFKIYQNGTCISTVKKFTGTNSANLNFELSRVLMTQIARAERENIDYRLLYPKN